MYATILAALLLGNYPPLVVPAATYPLQPTFQAYSVPITYSYSSAIPVGVVQQTYQVTQPAQASYYGAVQQYTTDTLVQVPVQATALYAAPAVTYSTPLLYNATNYDPGYYGRPLFFDRATLGVNYNYNFNRFSNAYNRAFFGTGFNNNVAIANGRGGLAIAGRNGIGNGIGGTSVAVANSRGIFGGNRQAIAVNGGGGAAVATARGGLFGGRSATAVAANGGTAVAHAGRR